MASSLLAQISEKPGSLNQDVMVMNAGTPSYSILNINNLTTWIRSNGISNHSPFGADGLYYPRGKGNVVYQDGLVFGGKVFTGGFGGTLFPLQPIRIGGGTYIVGTRAGHVTGSGAGAVPVSPSDAAARTYRIRRDYFVMSNEELKSDAADVLGMDSASVSGADMNAVRAQYELDWLNWPVTLGAPHVERNGQPGYQPPPAFGPSFNLDSLLAHDEPGVGADNTDTSADQVLWTVFNDLDSAQARVFAGSDPMGLEIQKTVWGYKGQDWYFSRYRFINRGGVDVDPAAGGQPGSFWIDSMFVGQWSDPDLGSFSDDLLGCDSLRNLGFVYNGQASDGVYAGFGLSPPAFAYDLLAGPVVVSPGDTAIFNMRRFAGFKNLGASSFGYFATGAAYSDPPPTPYLDASGRWWKILRGFVPVGSFSTADSPFLHPPGTPVSKFPFSGDPVGGTGFLDGLGMTYSFAPGDRRLVLSAGPFQLAPGDTQEMVIAGVAGLGSDRLSSIAIAKSNDSQARQAFYQGISGPVTEVTAESDRNAPMELSLSQNYPNPFNGISNFELAIVNLSHVELRVYDLLGREIATLVNESMQPGLHRIRWNSDSSPSGVYFARMQVGGFVEMRKVVLVK